MQMQWRVTAKDKDGEREVVLTETRAMAEFISACFADRGHRSVTIAEIAPPSPDRR